MEARRLPVIVQGRTRSSAPKASVNMAGRARTALEAGSDAMAYKGELYSPIHGATIRFSS